MRLGLVLGAVRQRITPGGGLGRFDPDFYRLKYPDLAHLSPSALKRHYLLFGRNEGRLGHAGDTANSETSRPKVLPKDFDPALYLRLNVDLMANGLGERDAAAHYLSHGLDEGRAHRRFNPEVYRELYFGGEQISDAALRTHYEDYGRALDRIGSAAELLAREGSPGAFWADFIRLQEFKLLNGPWAAGVGGYVEAARLMVAEGVDRLAAISFDLQFDPAYYRETHPRLASLGDAALYRRWLWQDMGRAAGSAAQHLRDLRLPLQAYPESFRWRDYARRRPQLTNRWAALDHLVRKGAATAPDVIDDDGGFLVALSQTLAGRKDEAVVALLTRALERGSSDWSALQWLGDAYYRLERWREAYDTYAKVARSAGAVVWSVANGARAAIRLERPDLALELVALGRAAFSGEQVWRMVVGEAVEAEFRQAWKRAEVLYLAGDRRAGDQAMTQASVRTAERWTALDPIGAPIPAHPDGRVVVLANVDLRQCTHYRVTQKADLMETLGRPYAIFPQAEADHFLTALPGASAAIFYRLPATPGNVRAILAARALGIATYYDIDDLIFDPEVYPEPLETYSGVTPEAYAGLQLGVPLFRSAMALCDQGIASTTALAASMRPVVRSGTVHVLQNALDHTNQGFLDTPPARSRRDGEFVIFYGSGTKAHNSDFLDLAGPALKTLMQRHAHVRLMIVGHLELDASFDPLRERITYMDLIPDQAAYWSVLAEADLNIAVLARHPTTDAKSEIKWVEAAVLGVPSIVSDTDRYREVLRDGIDALIAPDVEGWTAALERMVSEPELRDRLVAGARETLRRNYTLEANSRSLQALLPPLAPAPPPSGKARILLVNSYFPPQTVGGATRVLRDNLDYFLEHASDAFEFAVLTSDMGAETPYRIRVDDYRGVPVFRVSTPQEVNMDWRPTNPEIEPIVADVLALWRPDLVHAHALQRLTGSVLEACRSHGVPYIATVHDAWWLSDYPFLTDDKDRMLDPAEPWPLEPPPPVSPGGSLARRRLLHGLLDGAAMVLGVSEAFSRLYRQCGVERVTCVANGVPRLPAVTRSPSASGRVRLAHVGSQTYFKGYHHVQAALKQGRFANLELTVVDHRRVGGAAETTLWGATPVRFVGKTKQEEMQAFYADVDVLLAPSLWPESFGLVSREALNAGLWVLASDRGAIGEDVTPGRNGWVVDVSGVEGLLSALAEIDANPQRYLASPPPPEPPLRTADDQARDLLAIYRDLAAAPRPAPQPPLQRSGRPKRRWSLEARAVAAAEARQAPAG